MPGEAHGLPIQTVKLGYTYPPPRRVQALKEVDLHIAAGDFAAIIGHNGSGKTTMAKCLSGYLQPTRGQVLVGGTDLSRLRGHERSRLVGYVFQNPDHQLFKESVWDDVCFGLYNLGLPKSEVEARAEAVLLRLELGDKAGVHPFRLAKGDRQRLAIASILVMEPPALIVDEPTTGQDPKKAREIMDLLVDVNRERGMTVVVVTHAMDLVAEYCNRTVVMGEGQILLDGHPREVFPQTDILEKTFVSPPPVVRLGMALGLAPLPLTVAEACQRIAGGGEAP